MDVWIMKKKFFFRSDNGVSTKTINAAIKEYGNDNILVGSDPGETDRPSEDAAPLLDFLAQKQVPIHMYLVGPGMMSWSSQERAQIKRFAASVGINTKKADWHDKWIDWGWEEKVLEQFTFYHKTYNVYSCEIDNLDSALKPEQYIDYFIRLKKSLTKASITTKLFLKNLDDDVLHDLVDEYKRGNLGLDFLCEYAIFEKGTGKPRTQLMLCEQMGIQAITPTNGLMSTYNYGVKDDGILYECDVNNLIKV